MGLQSRTIQKLLREDFPGNQPLVIDPAARQQVGAEIASRLARFDGVDAKDNGHVPEDQKHRHVGSFSVIEPEPHYYYGRSTFRLRLDDANRLTIQGSYHGDAALVSDLDEIVQFVRHCKERLARHQALSAKRGKVRELIAHAILAQVKKLAKEERFDFMSESDVQKLRLYVKLSDQHAIELTIPFRDFKQVLPQLRSAIRALRRLYQSGIRFHVVGRRALPWRKTWIKYASLDAGQPEDDGSHSGSADGDSD